MPILLFLLPLLLFTSCSNDNNDREQDLEERETQLLEMISLPLINSDNLSNYSFNGKCLIPAEEEEQEQEEEEEGREEEQPQPPEELEQQVQDITYAFTSPTSELPAQSGHTTCHDGIWEVTGLQLNSFPDGDIELQLTFYSYTLSSSIHKDTISPKLTLSVNPDIYIRNAFYQLTGTCDEGGEVTMSITETEDRVQVPCVIEDGETDGLWRVEVDFSNKEDGEYSVVLNFADSVGNEMADALTHTLTKDITPPQLDLNLDTMANSSNQRNFTLQGACGSPGKKVNITVKDTYLSNSPDCTEDNTWSFTTSMYNYDDGGITIHLTHLDDAGNEARFTGELQKDTVSPILNSDTPITLPVNGLRGVGGNIDFILHFQEKVTVDTTGGTPNLTISISSVHRNANYNSGSGESDLTFRYTVQTTDPNSTSITLSDLILLNNGVIADLAGNTWNATTLSSSMLLREITIRTSGIHSRMARSHLAEEASTTYQCPHPLEVLIGGSESECWGAPAAGEKRYLRLHNGVLDITTTPIYHQEWNDK